MLNLPTPVCSYSSASQATDLIGRLLKESLAILSGVAELIELMDEGPLFIADPAVFESYPQEFVIYAPYHAS